MNGANPILPTSPSLMNGTNPVLPGMPEPEPEQHCNDYPNGHSRTADWEDACQANKPDMSKMKRVSTNVRIAGIFRQQTRSLADDEYQAITTAGGKVVLIGSEKQEDLTAKEMRNKKHELDKVDRENTTMRLISKSLDEDEHLVSSRAQAVALLIVNGRFFTSGITFLILLNAVFIGLETDFNDAEASGGEPHKGWVVTENIFTFLFMGELMLRMLSERLRRFFSDAWNVFDALIVVFAFADLVATSGGTGAGNLTVLRIFRILRLARIVRLLRVSKALQLLVAGIVGSARVLCWVWILLIIVIYIFAVFATRTIAHNHPNDQEVQALIGKLPRSMFTFFVIMTTEGWADFTRTLGSAEPVAYGVIVLFISVTTFAMINVVIAVIVDTTMGRAAEIKADASDKKKRIEKVALVKIMDVFQRADDNGDGMLTKEEFMNGLDRPDVRELLFSADVSLRDVDELFDILDTDGSGSLTCQEFLDGVQRARGEARAKDLLELHCDLWKAYRHQQQEIAQIQEDIDTSSTKRLDDTNQLLEDVEKLRAELDSQTSDLVKALREDDPLGKSAGN